MSVYGDVLRNLLIQLTSMKSSLDKSLVRSESSLTADLGLDSMDLVELSTRLSSEYAVVDLTPWLSRALQPGADTVGSLATYIADILTQSAS